MAPNEFHEEAHPEATELTGEREYGVWGQCVADARTTGERCTAPAKGPHGKCHSHGGSSTGAPEGNTNGVSHGAYADANAWYSEVASEAEREVVDDVFADYMERYEQLHGEPPYGHEAELFRIAVSVGKHIHAERWAQEKPDDLESGNALVDREVHYSDEGDEYYEYKETVVAKAQKRLSNDRRQWLKDFGLMEDAESKTADALAGLQEVWKQRASGEPGAGD